MSEFSLRTPQEFPLLFYSGHSPPLRRLAVRPPADASYRSEALLPLPLVARPQAASATSTWQTMPGAELAKARRPQWFLR